MRLDLLAALNTERAARRPCVVVTDLESGAQRLVRAAAAADDPMESVLEPALRSGKSAAVEHDGRSYFLSVHAPAIRLTLIGAVHISQALAPIAKIADFDVTIIDPRTAFATPERFPDTRVIAEWPDAVLDRAPLDRYSAIALLTHDPKIDDPALERALRAECFYIGALGSRKTQARRAERMRALGFGDGALARIHGPIGLDIGAVSPAEIAVSILGEIIGALRKKPLRAEEKAA
ncbi:MAG TPA: XdhC family protein [Roseiarcus sp.]|jgi:xanthine dehydrogenase accessory factor|nr:XdhC family protein [Roseiarcus sp.]